MAKPFTKAQRMDLADAIGNGINESINRSGLAPELMAQLLHPILFRVSEVLHAGTVPTHNVYAFWSRIRIHCRYVWCTYISPAAISEQGKNAITNNQLLSQFGNEVPYGLDEELVKAAVLAFLSDNQPPKGADTP